MNISSGLLLEPHPGEAARNISMTSRQYEITVATRGRDSVELTAQVDAHVRESGVRIGLCHVFVQHTSASLMLCENADPDVRRDLEAFMQRLAPDGDPLFVHQNEGPDDMPAHVRSVLTGVDLTVPIREGRLALGTWQGVYLWEHRSHPHRRRVLVSVQGD
jgi:secondary thiamine-phosphate synthase enzyme